MSKRIVSWLPWVLAEGTLGFLEAQLWPAGGLWLLLIWTAVLLLYRVALATASGRSVRVVGDLAFAGLCVLAVFEGGWYLLPAVVAFAACDAAGLTIELPSLPNDRGGYELRAALACTLLGWLGLAISVSGPIYASASSTVSANGVVVNSPPEVSLLQAGLTTQTALLLIATAALFGLVTIAALIHVRTGRPDAWRGLVAVSVALVALVVLSTMTVGLWLVPGGALALAAVQVGRPVHPSARRPVIPSSPGTCDGAGPKEGPSGAGAKRGDGSSREGLSRMSTRRTSDPRPVGALANVMADADVRGRFGRLPLHPGGCVARRDGGSRGLRGGLQ